MMTTLPITLPMCDQHGEMEVRPTIRQTAEQRFCGTWYDCHRCGGSVLFTSPELQAQLASR